MDEIKRRIKKVGDYMVYIDFDGVILDTEPVLFKEWRINPNRHSLPESEKIKYIQRMNWEYVLNNSSVINDALYYLKYMDPNQTSILTKVHSLENEGCAKIKWLRVNSVRQNVILVPYPVRKVDIVMARGNVLVDDCLKNLDEWLLNGGYPLFFDMDDDDYDSWKQPNRKKYQKIIDLSNIEKR